MKSIKRFVAITLSFVVIMTGIYWSEAPAKDVQAATTTEQNTDMLNVKVQVATNDTNVMRFVSSVDSLNYKSVGFEITPEGEGKTTHPIYTVFKRIASTTQGVEYTYSPKVVDTSSEYFMTAKWNATPNVNYTVRAFAVLPNGTTIYGTSRCVALEDGRSTTTHLNMSFQADNASELENVEEITNVTYAAANNTDETKIQTTTAKIIGIDGNTVHVRVQGVNGKNLASVTNFTFGTYGSGKFRNLLSAYDGSTGDASWYNDTDTEFIIASSADLYGLASLANDKNNTFADETIYVVSDIAVNSTTEGVTAKEWADADLDTVPNGVYPWTAVKNFAGTFDGQMHTISGIYLNIKNTAKNGLFGTIDQAGNVSNLYIKESMFKANYTELGSVAGICNGTISTVFSDAYVVNTQWQRSGGIVGKIEKSASVDNCWFDGELRIHYTGISQSGGIVGYIDGSNITFNLTDCLYTGEIYFASTDTSAWGRKIGGIIGGADDTDTPTINMENCLSAGTMECTDQNATGMNGVSSVYGGLDVAQLKLNLVNVYGTNECYEDAKQIYDFHTASGTVKGTGSLKNEADLKGSDGYKNTLLDFEDTWVARKDDVPALKAFTNEIGENEKAELTGVEQDGWYTTTETVFGIPSASALKKFSEVSETDNFQNKYVYLTNDIDLNPGWKAPTDATTVVTGNPENFVPIGNTKEFKGTFDGNKHTVQGIYCVESGEHYTGFFGQIGANAVVKNFAIKNSYFQQTNNYSFTGSAVAYCFNGTIQNVYSKAVVITDGNKAGGICGRAEGTVDGCWFDGNVYSTKTTATKVYIGGIVGCSRGGLTNGKAARTTTIKNCLNTGIIHYSATGSTNSVGIGGIFGADDTNVELIMQNCVSIGQMDTPVVQGIGAVVGTLVSSATSDGTTYYSVANLTNCYGANDCITGNTNRAVVQHIYQTSVTQTDCEALSTSALKGDAIYYNESIQLDYSKWIARANESPIPRVFIDWIIPASDTVFRPDKSWYQEGVTPLQIQDEEDMYGFMQLLLEGETFEGQEIQLMNDLNMNPVETAVDDSLSTIDKWKKGTVVPGNKWMLKSDGTPTEFAGTFDGNMKKISGIYCVDDNEHLGLFGITLPGSTLRNVNLTNSYFKQASTTGMAGSVAAKVCGTIDSVYSDAVVENAGLYTGGIFARAESTESLTLKNCWFDGVVRTTVTKTGVRVGGILGEVAGGTLEVDNCLFTGKMYVNDTMERTFVGGLVGVAPSNTVNVDSSIAAGEITATGGSKNIGAAIGYAPTGKFENTFVTRDTYAVAHECGGSFENQPVQTYNTDRLIGYCTEEEYGPKDGTKTAGGKLDFDTDWSMRIKGVPIPKSLEKIVEAENIVDTTKLTDEIGLNSWNKELTEAVDYGMGNYVISCDATLTDYTNYCDMLDRELDFDLYANNEKDLEGNDSDMKTDGIYNAIYTKASGDWVLNITFVQNDGKIYISISTIGEEGLSDHLRNTKENNELAKMEGEVSFSMLELVNEQGYGNGFVFKLPNGHFIVNDGGMETDAEQLVNYLKELAGTTIGDDGKVTNPVIIDAWIFTHLHQDHCGVTWKFYSDASLRDGVHVNGIYLSEPSLASKTLDPAGSEIAESNKTFRGLMTLTQQDGKTKPAVYRMHMGERYYFSGLTVDVVQAQEQIPVSTYYNYKDPDFSNSVSTNCVYTLNSTGKKILLGGDSNNVNMRYMMTAYGKSYETYNQRLLQYGGTSRTLSNINIFAAYHHGKDAIATYESGKYNPYPYNISGTATNEWADYLLRNTNHDDRTNYKFDAILFPYHQVFDMKQYTQFTSNSGTKYNFIWGGDDRSIVYPYNMSEINQYYIKNSNSYYTYGLDEYDLDGNKLNSVERHGTVQLIFNKGSNIQTEIYGSNITQ